MASLRESRLSLRAIAAATGDSLGTVQAESAGVQNRTPPPDAEPEPITGTIHRLVHRCDFFGTIPDCNRAVTLRRSQPCSQSASRLGRNATNSAGSFVLFASSVIGPWFL